MSLSGRAVEQLHAATPPPHVRWAPDILMPLLGMPWRFELPQIDLDREFAQLRDQLVIEEHIRLTIALRERHLRALGISSILALGY
jgi:hypothetical protein